MNAPVVLQVDALSCVLRQPFFSLLNNGTFDEKALQPVAYSSKSLTVTEQHYAQIEKECLPIVETFNKFDQRLLGKANAVIQHTDPQPLQSIF